MDGASSHVFVESQKSLSTPLTLSMPNTTSNDMQELGVIVDPYHTDNGVHKSQAFTEELTNDHQSIRFGEVDAKWQHGMAEGAINLVVSKVCTVMNHANLH